MCADQDVEAPNKSESLDNCIHDAIWLRRSQHPRWSVTILESNCARTVHCFIFWTKQAVAQSLRRDDSGMKWNTVPTGMYSTVHKYISKSVIIDFMDRPLDNVKQAHVW